MQMRRIASKTHLRVSGNRPPHDVFLPTTRKKNIYLINLFIQRAVVARSKCGPYTIPFSLAITRCWAPAVQARLGLAHRREVLALISLSLSSDGGDDDDVADDVDNTTTSLASAVLAGPKRGPDTLPCVPLNTGIEQPEHMLERCGRQMEVLALHAAIRTGDHKG